MAYCNIGNIAYGYSNIQKDFLFNTILIISSISAFDLNMACRIDGIIHLVENCFLCGDQLKMHVTESINLQ